MDTSVWPDFRHSARVLARRPGFSLAVVLTLSLGIGANTAIFSTVSALLLRPHDFPELDRLILLDETAPNQVARERFAPADYVDLRNEATVFGQLTAARFADSNLTGAGDPQTVEGYQVSANFFSLLGGFPERGRVFLPGEDEEGRAEAVVLSHGFWERRLGGDPGWVGKTIKLDGRAVTVVGIMPQTFNYPLGVELWTPLALDAHESKDRTIQHLKVIGRLRGGASMEQARAQLQAFLSREGEAHPEERGRGVRLLLLREEQYEYSAPLFLTLQGAACFVLLLACANVGNLVLARLLSRQKEMAIRTALGAGRARHFQLFLIEALLLTAIAAGVGTLGAFWGVDIIRTRMPPEIARWIAGWDAIRVSRGVLIFTLLVTFLVAAGLGLGAALQAGRGELLRALREGGRTSSSRERNRLQRAFVIAEVALAALLLVGAGLMVKGFLHLTDVYQGFEPAHVLTMKVSLPEFRYPDEAKVRAFYDDLLRGVASLPGVERAGVVRNLPANNEENERSPFTRENHPSLSAAEVPMAGVQTISPGYLPALKIPLASGRAFTDQDGPGFPPVVLLSQALAKRFWAGEDPIGQRVKLGAPDAAAPWLTIVGVVADVKQNWWNREPARVFYLPYRQSPRRGMDLAIRTSVAPLDVAGAARSVIQRLDTDTPLREIQPMDAMIADSMAPIRIIGWLMLVFGVVALGLSAVGVYGVLAQSVAQRTQELGVRIALGAQTRDVLRLVLGQALALSAWGLALGLPAALALSYAMASQLFGIVTLDAGLLVAFAAVLLGVAVLAAAVPALRATRVNPVVTLREP
jgi:putative ABC transport system permease protein